MAATERKHTLSSSSTIPRRNPSSTIPSRSHHPPSRSANQKADAAKTTMKAFFHRFKKDRDRDFTDNIVPYNLPREKLELPPLKQWPPPSSLPNPQNSNSNSNSQSQTQAQAQSQSQSQYEPKPLPAAPAITISQTNSQASSDSHSRASTRTPLPPQASSQSLHHSIAPPMSAANSGSSALVAAQPASRAASTDDRDRLGFSTITRTDMPRRNSLEPSTAGSGRPSARKMAAGEGGTSAISSTAESAAAAAAAKKVAFISPPPTPAPLQRVLSEPKGSRSGNGATELESVGMGAGANIASAKNMDDVNGGRSKSSAEGKVAADMKDGNMKTTVTRFQAMHGASEGRGSGNTGSSTKVNTSGKNPSSGKASVTATRTALSPTHQRTYADNASLHASMRSGTPYSQASRSTSRILATASWSEAAEEELVSNLGSRERTRQEVLWEIVASEERYVAELTKLKETFIEPLLHPYASVPITSPTPHEHDEFYARGGESPRESFDHLPIASRFLSPTPGLRAETPATGTTAVHAPTMSAKGSTPNIDGDSLDTDEDEAQDQMGKGLENGGMQRRNGRASALAAAVEKLNHPRSPYNQRSKQVPKPNPTRSHQSLPPPPRIQQGSSASLGRQSIYGAVEREREREVSYAATQQTQQTEKSASSRVLKKLRRATGQTEVMVGDSVAPHQLPEDLRKCLEVLEVGIFDGHVTLSEGLRKRYEEQYPLVRSLADVFVANSKILREYAEYVLHLERALEQVDNALSTASDKKKPKNQDAAVWMKICKTLQRLENDAAEKGETGLAISLSKPFQRLLKYPLLFQNLLYHTDPSTFEYEHTLQMVAEVEEIVRSIEDEKIQKEERDKTRDAFARIDGLEKVRQLALPKASRLLVEERPLVPVPSQTQSQPSGASRPPPTINGKGVRGKSSLRRLSDALGSPSKKDLWLVVFNDVVLRCQRTGITSLPLVSSTTNSRTNSLPDMQAKAKYATTGRRAANTKPRNLYKFIKIENWAIAGLPDPKEGVVSMDDVVRQRATVHSVAPTPSLMPPEEDEEEADSSDSDRKSKMSFSYWGADKITIRKPPAKPRGSGMGPGATMTTTHRKGSLTPLGYSRESSANAKFGTRLVSPDSPHHHHTHLRPSTAASRRTNAATPAPRRPNHSEDGHLPSATNRSGATTTTTTTSTNAANGSGSVGRDRPAWDGSTRPGTTTPVSAGRPRPRNLSHSSVMGSRPSNAKLLASPAPSEDSGVGLYRQFIAADSQLTGV